MKVTSKEMSDFAAERVSRGWQLFLQLPGRRSPRPRRCVFARQGARQLERIVKLRGVDSREAAAALRGARVFVRDSDIRKHDAALRAAAAAEAEEPAAGEEEFFVEDLVGLRVLLPNEGLRCAPPFAALASAFPPPWRPTSLTRACGLDCRKRGGGRVQ
jgi:ribosomal 30S subunit maturation factor RimM